MEPSKQLSLNDLDWKKIGKGAVIALVGALFTYLQTIILKTDFGAWTPIVMAGNSVLVNLIHKYFSGAEQDLLM